MILVSRILRHGVVTAASMWFGLSLASRGRENSVLVLCCLALSLLSALACLDNAKALWWLLRNKR